MNWLCGLPMRSRNIRPNPSTSGKLLWNCNVDTLLTGTFLREGDNLRIACQLIDVKSESLLWKGAF